METKHTPGPWDWHTYDRPIGPGETVGYYVDSSGGDICDVVGITGDNGVGGPNARLIAAAPELAEALNDLLNLPADDLGDRIIPAGFLDKARAALAKAGL